jgi:cell division transport system permease protein
MNFFESIQRVFKWGTIGFLRNGTVSFSAVLVTTIALFMICSTMLANFFLNGTLRSLEDKLDINVYFSVDAKEVDILALKAKLDRSQEIAKTEYVSKEQALEEFNVRHKDDELTIQALELLGTNPLSARLNIQATSLDKYEGIANGLSSGSLVGAEFKDGFIDKVSDNRLVIQRMNNLINGVRRAGSILAIVLLSISFLIIFNTIRLVIYISKNEISVMKLVGAGNATIQGPFIVEGIMYGVVATIITTISFFPITLYIKNHTQDLYGGIDLYSYYIGHFFQIFFILLGAGILLGCLSSLLAVHKYLKNI